MAMKHGGRGPGHLSRWTKAATPPAPPAPPTSFYLLNDGTSRILLNNGVDKLGMNS